MTLDLQHQLADLAASVDDDALTERLTVQVEPMVTRIRRRRAARATATGALSLGSVAAVALGAVALIDLGSGGETRPAATVPATAPAHDGAPLACGQQLPETLVGDDALAFTGETTSNVDPGGDLLATLRWWSTGAEEITYSSARVDVAVVRDGVVVGVAGEALPLGTEPVTLETTETGTLGSFAAGLPLAGCDGDALAAGSYRVVATVTLAGQGETWRASAGPWPLTVASAPSGAATDAEARVQEILAAAAADAASLPFGQCGSVVPDAESWPLTLELDLDSGSGMRYAPGERLQGVALLGASGVRSARAQVPDAGPTVVLVRDGVVVGGTVPAEGRTRLLSVTASGPQVLATGGVAEVCALPGAAGAVGLPAGIYQAYAVVPVTLDRVVAEDGTEDASGGEVVVHSRPVDVIVQPRP